MKTFWKRRPKPQVIVKEKEPERLSSKRAEAEAASAGIEEMYRRMVKRGVIA